MSGASLALMSLFLKYLQKYSLVIYETEEFSGDAPPPCSTFPVASPWPELAAVASVDRVGFMADRRCWIRVINHPLAMPDMRQIPYEVAPRLEKLAAIRSVR